VASTSATAPPSTALPSPDSRAAGAAIAALSHGCEPIGSLRAVTKSDRGTVYEIDGPSAWLVFKEYLDGDLVDLSAADSVHSASASNCPRTSTTATGGTSCARARRRRSRTTHHLAFTTELHRIAMLGGTPPR
jgi:hypothetical protein